MSGKNGTNLRNVTKRDKGDSFLSPCLPSVASLGRNASVEARRNRRLAFIPEPLAARVSYSSCVLSRVAPRLTMTCHICEAISSSARIKNM